MTNRTCEREDPYKNLCASALFTELVEAKEKLKYPAVNETEDINFVGPSVQSKYFETRHV